MIRIDADLGARVLKLKGVQAVAKEAADKIAAQARADAPVDSGDYQSQIVSQQTKDGARVYSGSNKSAWIEFGAPGHRLFGGEVIPLPAKFILRNATLKAGFKFKAKRHV